MTFLSKPLKMLWVFVRANILLNHIMWLWFTCCRSDWPGLCLFCCYQPLCVVSQQSWFGVFCFISPFYSAPPPRPQLKENCSPGGSWGLTNAPLSATMLPNCFHRLGGGGVSVHLKWEWVPVFYIICPSPSSASIPSFIHQRFSSLRILLRRVASRAL